MIKELYKQVIIEEFDTYYYKKLKKSMSSKIKSDKFEWIYSYGDKLIAGGRKSVFNVVKTIVEPKSCDNPYIASDEFYAKCQYLYEKYKNKKPWFSWFK